MPFADIPAFMVGLRRREGIATRALEMLILTVTRTGSLIGMQDCELDLEETQTWAIPAIRMKSGESYVVPLSSAAQKVLRRTARESRILCVRGTETGHSSLEHGHVRIDAEDRAGLRAARLPI